jgi:predicted membrane channel-forming protein YqfA (hemolysin III family)
MKLSPPKQLTFIIAVVLGLVGLVASYMVIPVLSPYAFWLVFVGLVVLAAGNMVEGL